MNTIKFELQILKDQKSVEYEGITYTNCAFIYLIVDDVNLFSDTEDRKGLIVWTELKKTRELSGNSLLLTCHCGVADDAGFELVEVKRKDNSVSWKFKDESNWDWEFPKTEYDLEIVRLAGEINQLDINIPLEPVYVLFPE